MPGLMPAIDADVDDRAAFAHAPCCHLRTDHDAVQVDGHDAIEVPQVVAHEPSEGGRDPGVVDHDVQGAEALDRDVHRSLDAAGVRHIRVAECGDITRPATKSLPASSSRSAMTTRAPSSTNTSAMATTETVRAFGDDSDFAIELFAHVATVPSNSRCNAWSPRSM